MDHDRLFKELLTTFFTEFSICSSRRWRRNSIAAASSCSIRRFTPTSDRVNGTKSISWRSAAARGASVYPDPCGESGDGESGIPKADVSVLRKTAREVRLPVYPIAIFSYDRPFTPAVDTFEMELFGLTVIRFQFERSN